MKAESEPLLNGLITTVEEWMPCSRAQWTQLSWHMIHFMSLRSSFKSELPKFLVFPWVPFTNSFSWTVFQTGKRQKQSQDSDTVLSHDEAATLCSEGPSSSSSRLSRGLLDGLFIMVGCRNSSGLSNGTVRVHTPQSLLDGLAWVALIHRQINVVSVGIWIQVKAKTSYLTWWHLLLQTFTSVILQSFQGELCGDRFSLSGFHAVLCAGRFWLRRVSLGCYVSHCGHNSK